MERDIVFNENDIRDGSVTISSNVLSEGEMEGDKIIQHPTNCSEDLQKSKDDDEQSEKQSLDNSQDPNMSSDIPFPSATHKTAEVNDKKGQYKNLQRYGRGQRHQKEKGAYKQMNEGLIAAMAYFEDFDDKDEPPDAEEDSDYPLNNFAFVATHPSDPKMLDEALSRPDAKQWEEALQYEINQLEKLGTWKVEDLPAGQTAILCSEVIRVKRGPNGEVQSYRVRIVAGGHRQTEGVNYTKTFSAAAKMPTVHAVLANAAHQDWEIEHVDVKSTYLNAELKETIYMKAPRGVLKPGRERKVLRLKKGLYGLKQAGRGWYLEMSRVFVKELGFTRSAIDHSVFYQRDGETHVIVAVATDDMAVTSKHAACHGHSGN
jgi:Reverse transcriptase (RNA-dependent DNA polymerase)